MFNKYVHDAWMFIIVTFLNSKLTEKFILSHLFLRRSLKKRFSVSLHFFHFFLRRTLQIPALNRSVTFDYILYRKKKQIFQLKKPTISYAQNRTYWRCLTIKYRTYWISLASKNDDSESFLGSKPTIPNKHTEAALRLKPKITKISYIFVVFVWSSQLGSRTQHR